MRRNEYGASKVIIFAVVGGFFAVAMLIGPKLMNGSSSSGGTASGIDSTVSVVPHSTTTVAPLPQSDRNPFG
jgi:hypothetical protein